jgi:hypothetical protein
MPARSLPSTIFFSPVCCRCFISSHRASTAVRSSLVAPLLSVSTSPSSPAFASFHTCAGETLRSFATASADSQSELTSVSTPGICLEDVTR